MVVNIKKTKERDIYALAENMRDIDKKELKLVAGDTPVDALKYGLEHSYFIRTIFYKGQVMGIFGACKPCVLSDKASVWLLGAQDFFKIRKDLLKYSKAYIKKMLNPVEMLENDVWVENIASIRWLKWCGFKFEEPRPFGIKKALFQHFYMRKEK